MSAQFSADLNRFKERLRARARAVFEDTTRAVLESVTEGSPITGAPGQPVDTGALKSSYYETGNPLPGPGEWEWQTTSNLPYARAIEEGMVPAHERGPYERREHTRTGPTSGEPYTVRSHTVRRHSVQAHPIRLRSESGGFHSLKLTRANFQALVDDVARKVGSQI